MLECGLLAQCINKTTIRNNYWILFLIFHYQSSILIFQHKVNFLFYYVLNKQCRNLTRIALRYVIKIQVRLNGGHIPYLSNVTLWAVLPSNVIPIRGTRQQNKNNNYILSPTLNMKKPIQKSLKVCHKNPRETSWRSYSLLIQCDPLSGITFPRNTGQRGKTTEQKQQLYLKSNVV